MSGLRHKLLQQQLNYRRDPGMNADKELAALLMKPEHKIEHLNLLDEFLDRENLSVIFQTRKSLCQREALAIYNDIFRFGDNDILFGLEWKKRKLEYMTTGISFIQIVEGKNAQSLCESFKYELRDKYGKLSVPDKKLSNDEFEELAIKNLIHVVDADETEVAIWLFA